MCRCTNMHRHRHIYTNTHVHAHMCTHTHTHTHIHTHTLTCTRTHNFTFPAFYSPTIVWYHCCFALSMCTHRKLLQYQFQHNIALQVSIPYLRGLPTLAFKAVSVLIEHKSFHTTQGDLSAISSPHCPFIQNCGMGAGITQLAMSWIHCPAWCSVMGLILLWAISRRDFALGVNIGSDSIAKKLFWMTV